MPYQSVLTGNNVPAAKQGQYQSVLSGFVPGQYAKVNAQIAIAHTDPATLKDVPSLNAAYKTGQINQGQYMTRLKQFTSAGTPNIPTGLKALPSVINEQDIQPVKNTFVGAYQKAVSQAKYLAGPTSTQPQRNTIINNQKAAATNPAYASAAANIKPGTNSAAGLIQAQKLAASGAKTPQIKTFLQQDAQKLATQTKAGLVTAGTIASFSAPGEGILAKTLGRAKTAITDTAESAAGKATDVIHGPNGDVAVKPSAMDAIQTKGEQKPSPAPTAGTPKSSPSPVTGSAGESLGAGKGSPKGLGEAGGVAPGQVVQDTQAMLDKHAKVVNATGNISEDYLKTAGRTADIKLDTATVLKNRTPLSNADKQTLQDYRDAKAAGLTPQPLPSHLQEADANITALNKAAQAADAEKARLTGHEQLAQKIEARDPSTYTHSIAQGKGSNLELTVRGDRQNPLSIGSLSKTTAGSKKQTFFNATDEAGNRRTVAIKDNKVTALSKGGKTSEELGNLNLKKNQDFLDKELQPYQTKIKNLQKEGDALSNVKTKTGVSQSRLKALAQKVSLLEDPGNMTSLTKAEAKSLRDAKLKLQELTNVKDPRTNVTGRLKTINQHLINMNNEVSKIHAKYDPETLDQKMFVGKDGKKYTIGQATQQEKTLNTGQKYYVDPELTSHLNYADSRVSLENTRFVEGTKKILEDKGLAIKQGEATAPKSFQTTHNPYFAGYKLQPRLAEVLDDIAGGKPTVTGKALGKVSRVLRQTIVYLPIKHDFNEGAGYIIDRGLTSWLNPVAYGRMGKSLYAGVKGVVNQDELYRNMLRSGSSLMTADDKQLGKVVAKQVKGMTSNPQKVAQFAKAFGMSPARAYKAFQKVTVWDVQDILNYARVHERMQGTMFSGKMSFEDALKNTEKTNFQYRVPSRVAGSRMASEILQGNTPLTYFGRYTYDKFRIAKNILKGAADVRDPKAAFHAADQLAATVAISAVLWPQVDKGLQKISGDKNAHITAPGVASVAEMAQKVITHKEAPLAAAGSQVSVAQPISLGAQLLGNKDSFTGKNIRDPNATAAQKTEATAKWLFSQLAPNQKLATTKNATANKTLSTALALAGASLPKSSPETNKLDSLKYDTLPGVQSQAKAAAAKGDTQKAIGIIAAYDQRILAQAQAAAKAEGKAMPSAQQLKQAGYYYDPTNATVQSWTQTKANAGTLQNILNQTVAPKKGESGYYQYEAQKKLKTQQTKTYNRFHPSANQPIL